MGAAMPDLFLVQSRFSRVDFPCSLRDMMLVLKGDNKLKIRLEFFFYLVDLLKLLVAICVRRLYGFCALYAALRRKYDFCA